MPPAPPVCFDPFVLLHWQNQWHAVKLQVMFFNRLLTEISVLAVQPDDNPYRHTDVGARSDGLPVAVSRGQRIAWGFAGMIAGGIIGAFLHPPLWLMFYGFEGTVIEETLYESGSPAFSLGMKVFGAVTGLILGCLCLQRVFLALFLHSIVGCVVALLAAFAGLYWTTAIGIAAACQIPTGIVTCTQLQDPPVQSE